MRVRTEQRQFRPTAQSGQHVLAMQPEAFGFFFFGGFDENRVTEDGIAIVSVCGPLEHHGSWFDSYDSIVTRLEEAFCDDAVRAVVMCIDSPGGDASGVEEAHRKILALKEKHGKPLCAYSNESCYSAAYWLACAADDIWLPPTGGVGSVGVIAAAVDCTKLNEKMGVKVELITTGDRKADGHPDRPLTDEVIEVLQARVDQIGKVFFGSVGEARGVTPDDIQGLEAACFLGQLAVDAGLADEVAGWDEFMASVRDSLTGVDAPGSGSVDMGESAPGQTSRVDERSERGSTSMKAKTLLSLTKSRNTARAAVEAAKTPTERKAALKALEKASDELAKMKYSKKTVEEKHEEDKDDADEEESDESEEDEDDEPPPAKKKDDDSDDDDDDEDEDEESEDEESDEDADEEEADEEEAAAKQSKALSGLMKRSGHAQVRGLYRAVAKLTGKANVSEQLGALSAFSARISATAKLEKRVAQLETKNSKDRVEAMLTKASLDGRVSPGQLESLRAQGTKDPKWLKGYLASTPKKVRTVDDGARSPDPATGKAASFSRESMSAEQIKVVEDAAAAQGTSFDKYLESMNSRPSLTGTAPTH